MVGGRTRTGRADGRGRWIDSAAQGNEDRTAQRQLRYPLPPLPPMDAVRGPLRLNREARRQEPFAKTAAFSGGGERAGTRESH